MRWTWPWPRRGPRWTAPWGRLNATERGRLLVRTGQAVQDHAEELAQIGARDTGKPITTARGVDRERRPPAARGQGGEGGPGVGLLALEEVSPTKTLVDYPG